LINSTRLLERPNELKKYNGDLIGLYEPDYFDIGIVIQKYANTKYKIIAYFEQSILSIPIYYNIIIETSFSKFVKKV